MVAWLWIFSDAGEAENVAKGKEGSLMLANSLTYSCIWYFYVYLLWGVFRLFIMLCYFFIFNIFFHLGRSKQSADYCSIQLQLKMHKTDVFNTKISEILLLHYNLAMSFATQFPCFFLIPLTLHGAVCIGHLSSWVNDFHYSMRQTHTYRTGVDI